MRWRNGSATSAKSVAWIDQKHLSSSRRATSSIFFLANPLANPLAADVIDFDTFEQRSGLFFAVWGMTTKLSLALGVLLGTTLPATFRNEPSSNATPSSPRGARHSSFRRPIPCWTYAPDSRFEFGNPGPPYTNPIDEDESSGWRSW